MDNTIPPPPTVEPPVVQPIQPQQPPVTTPPPPMPVTPPPPAAKKPNVLMLILVMIALIGIGAAGIYYSASITKPSSNQNITQISPTATPPSPTPDQTANWKKFSNNVFEVKLPPNWIETIRNGEYIYSSGKPGRSELIIGKASDKTFEELKNHVIGLFNSPPKTKELMLGSAQSTEYYGCAGIEGCLNEYILITMVGKDIYQIDFTTYPDQDPNLYSTLISTLKFTDGQADVNQGWKTFSNDSYYFSFEYPKNWIINTPSLDGKHETNKTLLQVNLTSTSDFKNAALFTKNKEVIALTFTIWPEKNQSFADSIYEWDNFMQRNPPLAISDVKTINNNLWTIREKKNVNQLSPLPEIEYSIDKNGFIYIISIAPSDSTLIDKANQILSTFKFTN